MQDDETRAGIVPYAQLCLASIRNKSLDYLADCLVHISIKFKRFKWSFALPLRTIKLFIQKKR